MKNTILAVALLVSTIAFSQIPSQKLDIGLLEGNRFKVFSRTSNKITQIKDTEWVTLDKIGYDGKTHHIGTYDTDAEAAKAYDLEAIRVHGVKALCNFSS